jgi:predicted nucleotidyltransferase
MNPMQVGHLSLDDAEIAAFCEKWGIAELAVFGSVLRDDFGPESDVDFLVTWKPGASPATYFRLFELRDELSRIVRRPADLAEKQLLERSYNEFRRQAILSSATRVYAAA